MSDNKKQKKPDSFITDGLSIDETKLSMLMITYVICFFVTLIFFIKTQDGEGLKAMFFSNIGAIAGVNVTNSISNAFSSKSTNDNYDDDDYYPKG